MADMFELSQFHSGTVSGPIDIDILRPRHHSLAPLTGLPRY